MSISIGGGENGANGMPGSEEQNVNISDVSHLLLYDNAEEGEGGQEQSQEASGQE